MHGNAIQLQEISFVAGGTGITPFYQLIRAMLREEQPPRIRLIYANHSEKDILLRQELEELAAKYPQHFELYHVLSTAPEEGKALWRGSVGRLDYRIFRKHLSAPSERNAVFICGPPPMIEEACLPNLAKMGYDEENMFEY